MRKALSTAERRRLAVMMHWENIAKARGFLSVAGVDEAGRGPLAGPVVAAACVLPDGALIAGINDSKKLLPTERFRLFQQILALSDIDYGIGVIDSLLIDQVNILQATFQAMIAAISCLKSKPHFLLVDGLHLPESGIPGEAIVEGDGKSQSIAAASIIAKVTRDQLMKGYHQEWPQYGFDSHKGYGTKKHLLAIEKYGPCPIHRMSFEPLKSLQKRPVSL
jgi:ribonuclease HII